MSWISLASKLTGDASLIDLQPAFLSQALTAIGKPTKREDSKAKPGEEFEELVVVEENEPSLSATKGANRATSAKRAGKASTDDEEPAQKKRPEKPSDDMVNQSSLCERFSELYKGPRPLDANQVVELLRAAWNVSEEERQRLEKEEWLNLVESLFGEIDWKGLDTILSLVRHEGKSTLPDWWLPTIYQSASRLLRDPSGASQAIANSSTSSDTFKSGAFREHPSAFFDIGKEGGVRLGARGRCWGRLRGYTFCCWVNLRKREQVEEGGNEEEESLSARQLYRYGTTSNGARLECYVVDGKDSTFQLIIRSRTSGTSSWTTCECPVAIALNRWHFIVISHARPYLLGKAKINVFVDGTLQKGSLSVPFVSGKEMDDTVVGYGFQGLLGAPSLFEGGDVTAQEAVILCERTRVRVENPHIVGGPSDEVDCDDEDDEMTAGLGYGREDAADHQVDASEFMKELASRAGVAGNPVAFLGGVSSRSDSSTEESAKKTKKMIFAFDPRASTRDTCPELVIRGTRRGKKDALELTADDLDSEAGTATLVEDEHEDDALLFGECRTKWESSIRRDAIELAGGARALLLAVLKAPSNVIGDALMLVGDALHADAHLRTAFLGMEGFGLIGREIRKRFYKEEDDQTTPMDESMNESEGVIVQVALHMMRAAPVNSATEKDFFYAGLKELLFDSRVSSFRALQSLRLVSGLAAEKPRWVREAVGVDGILRFMLRLESNPDAQAELATDVLRPVWSCSLGGMEGEAGPTQAEVASVLCFVSEHPSSAGSRALLYEIIDFVKSQNTQMLRSLTVLGGVSYLLRIGSFAERNVKNPSTGIILRDPDPLPSMLGSSATPPETRAALVELIGTLMSKRAAAVIPMDADNPASTMFLDSEPTEHDFNVQLGALLGLMKSTDYVESNELVLSSLLDFLPKPHGFFVWAPLAIEAGDVKGMARVADALRRGVPLAKALLNQRGWIHCFIAAAVQPGPLGVAAKSALVAVISRAEDGRALETLCKHSTPSVWGETVRRLVESSHEELAPNLLVKALLLARRRDMPFTSADDKNAFYLKCITAAEFLRNGTTSYWQATWAWILHALPETDSVEVAAACIKLAMSLTGKEFAKTSSDNRRRVLQLLKVVGASGFEGPAGQLRAEACLGIVQTYSLADDNGVTERMVQDQLEHANTVQDAVKKIVDALPQVPPAPELTEANAPSSPQSAPLDPPIWISSRNVVGASIRLKQALKARIVEDLRDRLAHKVTDKVRDRRFDARWAELHREDGIEARALEATTLAWMLDESFSERLSRLRRRLVYMTDEEEASKLGSVVSRNALFQQPDSKKATPSSTTMPVSSESALGGQDSDWVKIGEEISRRTQVKGHSDLNDPVGAVGPKASIGEDDRVFGKDDSLPPTPTAGASPNISSATQQLPAQPKPVPGAEAKARKMTLEEWVNRPPMSIRGELEGKWIDPKSGERITFAARSFIVRPRGEVPGRLVVTNLALYFDPDPPGAAGNYYKLEPGEDETLSTASTTLEKDVVEVRQRWSLRGIQRVLLRRHRMLESGIELFMRGDASRSVFLRFEDVSVPKKRCRVLRDRIVRSILGLMSRPARERSQHPRASIRGLVEAATAAWRVGAMSNFDYLMELNMLAGRSFHDLCQYPVFPWVLADYRSEEVDLDDPRSFRDLSKPMGALEPSRLEQFVERYETFDDPAIPKFMFGSHYSTAAGVVLHFLVRLEPFRSLHVEMHDNRYDVPDRLFTSVPQAWEASSASQDLGEVKELTPEFYCLPAAFENRGNIDLGTSQTGVSVGAVELPPWAKGDAQIFVRTMRSALESAIVSSNIHKWLNLVFGFQQRGPNAVQANNVFYYLTYPGAVDLESIDDVGMRRAVELQIAHFGQCPEQLEAVEPWAARDYIPSRPGPFSVRPRNGVDSGFVIDQEIATLQARVVGRRPITSVPADDSNNDDGGGGGVLALRDDGTVVQLIKASGGDDNKSDSRVSSSVSSSAKGALKGVRSPCVWSPDGTLIIYAGRAAQGTVELALFDVARGEGVPTARGTLFAHDENVSALAYDDGLLVTGAHDGAVRLWRVGRSGALRRTTVWTQPRRFLRGHFIGQPITCCAVDRAMGVVATASTKSGLMVHDTISGAILWRKNDWVNIEKLCWDRPSGCLFVVFVDSSLSVVSIDGSVLGKKEVESAEASEEERIVCFERIAAGIIAIARPSAVDLVELPTLRVVQTWPLPDVCAITPPERILAEFVQDDHVVVNLITASRTIFVLRRSSAPPVQGAFRLLREAPTAVVGVVGGVVSGATRGVTLIGALDNVRKGVEVGKGVASEAWDVFSLATGFNKQ